MEITLIPTPEGNPILRGCLLSIFSIPLPTITFMMHFRDLLIIIRLFIDTDSAKLPVVPVFTGPALRPVRVIAPVFHFSRSSTMSHTMNSHSRRYSPFPQVSFPTMSSAVMPCSVWNLMVAAWVTGPKSPSGVTSRIVCQARTAHPESPRLSSGT